ncbi:MAG TPA: hypothetical protein VFB21_23065 [Chthonomonadaceae bacterium]|nr:hypothetical protein [Chthonomonadaceae bacterium]
MTKRAAAALAHVIRPSETRRFGVARQGRSETPRALRLRQAAQPFQTDVFIEALWPSAPAMPDPSGIRVARRDLLSSFTMPVRSGLKAEESLALAERQTAPPLLAEPLLRPQ